MTNWLLSELKKICRPADAIIAHSMGGLALLQLILNDEIKYKHAIVVESFLNPPPKFFQNLHSDFVSPTLANKINQMLNAEMKKYDPRLFEHLRNFQFDFQQDKANELVDICFIYGDRGQRDTSIIHHNLDWPTEFKNTASVFFVPNSCHFPMIENPVDFYKLLNGLFG